MDTQLPLPRAQPADDSHAEEDVEIDADDLCPICRHLLHRPVLTKCGHALCEPCLSEWADVSGVPSDPTSDNQLIIDNELIINDEAGDDEVEVPLQAHCPMCRTLTTATRSDEIERRVKERYTELYDKREEEYRVEERSGRGAGVEGVILQYGNTARMVEGRDVYDWMFFLVVSKNSIVNEVEILLHNSFKQSRVVKRRPPFSVRREGWGTFTVKVNVVLKAGYSWISSDAEDTRYAKAASLPLEWTLRFDGGSGVRRMLEVKNERRRLRQT